MRGSDPGGLHPSWPASALARTNDPSEMFSANSGVSTQPLHRLGPDAQWGRDSLRATPLRWGSWAGNPASDPVQCFLGARAEHLLLGAVSHSESTFSVASPGPLLALLPMQCQIPGDSAS